MSRAGAGSTRNRSPAISLSLAEAVSVVRARARAKEQLELVAVDVELADRLRAIAAKRGVRHQHERLAVGDIVARNENRLVGAVHVCLVEAAALCHVSAQVEEAAAHADQTVGDVERGIEALVADQIDGARHKLVEAAHGASGGVRHQREREQRQRVLGRLALRRRLVVVRAVGEERRWHARLERDVAGLERHARHLADSALHAKAVAEVRQLGRVGRMHRLANQRTQAETRAPQRVGALAAGEQLGDDENVGPLGARHVDEVLGDVHRRVVAVVDAQTVE
jgi:hypothetical protein